MRGLADFAGRWRIERVIEDRLSGQEGRFDGTADLVPDGAGLSYVERGALVLGGGAPMTAERRYLWRAGAAGIAVLFADGAPFHSFDPAGAAPEAGHDCAPDRYDVAYDFTGWPVWRTVWEVRGPRKDYRMATTYRR